MLTFSPPILKSFTLIPHNSPEAAGRFRIWLQYAATEDASNTILIWDRKTKGGFPELKEVVSIVALSDCSASAPPVIINDRPPGTVEAVDSRPHTAGYVTGAF